MAALLTAATEADAEQSVALTGSVSVVPSGVFDGAVIKLSIQADALTKTEFRTIRSFEPFTINGKTGQTLFAKVENGGSNTALDLSVL